MGSSRVQLTWADLWSNAKGMTPANQKALAQQLDDSEGGFPHWIRTRSPKVQVEVLENAPESVVQYMYQENVLSPWTISYLNLPLKTTARIVDNRRRRR